MSAVPTVEEVRAWVNVSEQAISDEDLDQIRIAELAIQARTCRVPASPFVVVADGLDVRATATGQTPGTLYRIAWGDTYSEEIIIGADGSAEASHTYAEAGTYTGVLFDADMHALAHYTATLPTGGVLGYDYPAALARALLRRCQRQVAARNVPLGAFGVESSEYGPVVLTSWDAEVSRLEATYRIPVIA